MDAIGEYLLDVIGAALICTVITALAGKSATLSAMIKLLTGVFLTLTLVSPLMRIRIPETDAVFDDFTLQAETITASAENSSRAQLSKIIKSKTEAYILDKAKQMGAEITVQVTLDQSNLPQPAAILVSGRISPYAKKQLSSIIEEDLGICTEAQTWNS